MNPLSPEVERQYRAARSNAVVFEWPQAGVLRVTGLDARDFLHNIVTNDVKSVRPGSGCYSAFLTSKGKVIGDFLLLAKEEEFMIVSYFAPAEALAEAIGRFVISEDVTIENESRQYSIISAQGPEAERYRSGKGDGAPGAFQHASENIDGLEVLACHVDHFGDGGVDFLVNREAARGLTESLRAKLTGSESLDEDAREVLRVEAGWPRYGLDMDESSLLVETGLEQFAVSFTKGCYVGQEFVTRITQRGQAARHLRGLVIQNPDLPDRGSSILLAPSDPKPIGEVRSVAFSPAINKPAALAYISTRPEGLKHVFVQTSAGTAPAEIIDLPFYHPVHRLNS
ncbi:MAG: aminomethyl transferase family protein [Nitrospirae bacterium]|nr:aminomethyl transferase family protein [Nitrospirota bacterium]